MAFDTTLTDLALERERLGVEKLKLQLEDAREQLAAINSMVPMVIPEPEPEPTPNDESLGAPISGAYQIFGQKEYDGSSGETALICWAAGTTAVDDALWEAVRLYAQNLQRENAAAAPAEPGTETQPQPEEPAEVNAFHVILKVTEKDRALGGKLVWQGFCVTRDPADGSFRFTFFDASGVEDYSAAVPETPEEPEIDFGSGFCFGKIV